MNLFHLKNYSEASACFRAISWQPSAPGIYYLAQLYLARIALLENQMPKACLILGQFELPPHHPIACEKAYLEGLIYFINNDYIHAIDRFEQFLAKKTTSSCKWAISAQRYLISSYLHEAKNGVADLEKRSYLLGKAHLLLIELDAHSKSLFSNMGIPNSKEEIDHFLLGDLYLLQAHLLNDQEALQAAKTLFSNTGLFSSPEAKLYAALKFADTLPDYQDRMDHYQNLMNGHFTNEPAQAEILHWQGLNLLKEGLCVYQTNQSINQSLFFFERAMQIFAQAYSLSAPLNKRQADQALKYYSLAVLFNRSNRHLEQSALFLKELIEARQAALTDWCEPEELYFLTGLIWKRLAENDDNGYFYAEKMFNQLIDQYPSGKYAQHAAKALGLLYMQQHEWKQAEEVFIKWMEQQPEKKRSTYLQGADAELLIAMCAEKLNQPERKRSLLQKIFSKNPHSAEAPVAYFYTYNYREYLKGHRKAIKHLQLMPSLFPDHPLIISAHYLTGLDYLKDHLSNEGSILRRKDLIAAIDAFQKSETAFDSLLEKKKISTEALPYFIHIRYRSMLEKALANLAIAESSHGAKSQIYLEYAEETFHQLINNLQKPDPLAQELLINSQANPHLLEESYYWLAKSKLKKNQLEAAIQTLDLALQLYEKANMSQGYLLSRILYEKGKIAQKQQEHANAILCFQKAEEAASEKPCLSPDQKLDLWIEQSLSYKEIGDLENAMLLLSKAVNDEAISALRVKAMFLRVELYDLQGRPELALKQLEAVAKKGGEWGKLAKNKLEGSDGY